MSNEAREAAVAEFMLPIIKGGGASLYELDRLAITFRFAFDAGVAEGIRQAREAVATLADGVKFHRSTALTAIDALADDARAQ